MIFKGSGVAIVTPFNEDYSINYDKFEELIEFQIASNTDAIIVCGTTGESSTLNDLERKELIKFCVKVVNKRVPVIAGSGTNNTEYSCELSRYCQSIGADAVLLVTPYYNKCSQEGLYLHFKKIANSITIPVIIYSVPSRTSVNIEPNTIVRLSEISNIVGIKEASSNISQIAEIASKVSTNFSIYSGNDDQIVPILSLGGIGVISVLANILPLETHNMCQNFFDGNIQESKNLQLKYFELIKSLFTEPNPIAIKEAMNILGYNVGNCRLPLCNLSLQNLKLLKNALESAI